MTKKCKKCGCQIEKGVCLNCGHEGMFLPKSFVFVISVVIIILFFVLIR